MPPSKPSSPKPERFSAHPRSTQPLQTQTSTLAQRLQPMAPSTKSDRGPSTASSRMTTAPSARVLGKSTPMRTARSQMACPRPCSPASSKTASPPASAATMTHCTHPWSVALSRPRCSTTSSMSTSKTSRHGTATGTSAKMCLVWIPFSPGMPVLHFPRQCPRFPTSRPLSGLPMAWHLWGRPTWMRWSKGASMTAG